MKKRRTGAGKNKAENARQFAKLRFFSCLRQLLRNSTAKYQAKGTAASKVGFNSFDQRKARWFTFALPKSGAKTSPRSANHCKESPNLGFPITAPQRIASLQNQALLRDLKSGYRCMRRPANC
ncbi:hypothetical protein [Hymenobacter sp. B1770]|uniref:hypothetical protein n=1 Tax=Hymenobacter sp. B1770 TaxID=1718788 RepID=UPI003CF591A6